MYIYIYNYIHTYNRVIVICIVIFIVERRAGLELSPPGAQQRARGLVGSAGERDEERALGVLAIKDSSNNNDNNNNNSSSSSKSNSDNNNIIIHSNTNSNSNSNSDSNSQVLVPPGQPHRRGQQPRDEVLPAAPGQGLPRAKHTKIMM